MTHPSELELSMLADEALPAPEATRLTEHVDACEACRTRLAALREESTFLATMMALEGEAAERPVPQFTRPASLRGFAILNLSTALVIWLVQFLWKTLFGELVIEAADWATSVYMPDIYEMTSTIALYVLQEGTAMLDSYLGFVVTALAAITALSLLLMRRRALADAFGVCLLIASAAALTAPAPAHAVELRRSEDVVSIPAEETIDDTLLVASETVRIAGDVTGNLVAVGKDVEISGTVGGNVIAFAETVTISGDVGGTIIGGASAHTIETTAVAGDLWLAGDRIEVLEGVRVDGNAAFAGERASVAANVGKDLLAAGETIEVSGEVGQDVETAGARLRLLSGARIGGNVRFRGREERLYRDDDVVVDGEVEIVARPERPERRNRYLTLAFYLWQVGELIAAFLFGLALFWLVPGLGRLNIGAGVEGLKTAGVGFIALVSVPVAAVLVALTLIGMPFAFFGFIAWLLGLYVALILVGAAVGRMVLGDEKGLALTLLAGLAMVGVIVNLPFVGGLLGFLLTLVGYGLLVQYLFRVLPTEGPAGAAGG